MLATLISQAHRIATGQELSIRQAGRYFHDPKELVRIIRQTGTLRSKRKRAALAELLLACEREDSHGI